MIWENMSFLLACFFFKYCTTLQCLLLILPLNMNMQGNKEDGNAANHTRLLKAVRVRTDPLLVCDKFLLINVSA